MLSSTTAFWPLFWSVIGGGAVLTVAVVLLLATAARRTAVRVSAPRQAEVTPVPSGTGRRLPTAA